MLCFSKQQQTFNHPWQKQLLLPMLSLSQGEMQGHCFSLLHLKQSTFLISF